MCDVHLVIVGPRVTCQISHVDHSSDQKLRDFRPPYLTKNIIIREYLNLGKISRAATKKLRDFATT